jgi:hypothetical protein
VATISFDLDLILDTEEAVQNFLNALEAADRRGPLETRDFSEELRRGRELIAKGCPFDD